MPTPTLTDLTPEIGARKTAIETPALVVDLDQMERNLETFATFAEDHDVSLRSHSKTHKIPDLAHLQHDRTGGGIVCQKVSEAEVMAQSGIDDIYLSYIVIGERKLDRVARLTQKLDRFATTVDGEEAIAQAEAAGDRNDTTIEVVLEVNIGYDRVGAPLGEPAVALAETIADQPHLSFRGLMGFEGHIAYGSQAAETEAELDRRCRDTMDELEATVEAIEAAGVPVSEVGVGSTATARYSGKHDVITEIHPGMYLFNDANLVTTPVVEKHECALTVLTTVISTPANDRIVVDAGGKTISLDMPVDPLFAGDDAVHFFTASEEHGWVDVSDAAADYAVGDRIEFIPPHVCPTVNLHDTVIGVRDDRVEDVWSVQARGKVK